VARLKNLSSGEDWDYVELELELDGSEGYLCLKLVELLGLQLTSYNSLTITLLTRTVDRGKISEGRKDHRSDGPGAGEPESPQGVLWVELADPS